MDNHIDGVTACLKEFANNAANAFTKTYDNAFFLVTLIAFLIFAFFFLLFFLLYGFFSGNWCFRAIGQLNGLRLYPRYIDIFGDKFSQRTALSY